MSKNRPPPNLAGHSNKSGGRNSQLKSSTGADLMSINKNLLHNKNTTTSTVTMSSMKVAQGTRKLINLMKIV